MPITLPDPTTVTPEQLDKLKEPMVKAIIESVYLDGVDDLSVEWGDSDNTIATGKFLDKRIGQPNRIFAYTISMVNGEPNLDYSPVSGDFAEPFGWQDDEDLLLSAVRSGQPVPELEFNEGDAIDENWMANHEEAIAERLEGELIAIGLAEFVG